MWVLPSRGRPHNIRRLVNAYICTGAMSPVWLRVDEDDKSLGGYLEAVLPHNWTLEIGQKKPLSGYYNELYEKTSYDWYGFIADDVVPKTLNWDAKLIDLAGTDGMAVPAGAHGELESKDGTPHFVLGGDLVRETGFLCVPGLDRVYIDTAWADIARKKGVFRYAPDIILKHVHFSNGALMDKTYLKKHKDKDKAIYEEFIGDLNETES